MAPCFLILALGNECKTDRAMSKQLLLGVARSLRNIRLLIPDRKGKILNEVGGCKPAKFTGGGTLRIRALRNLIDQFISRNEPCYITPHALGR